MSNKEAYLKFGESHDLRTIPPKEFDIIYNIGIADGLRRAAEIVQGENRNTVPYGALSNSDADFIADILRKEADAMEGK